MPNLGLALTSTNFRFSGEAGPFSPVNLPNLELWLEANSGVLNDAGNNFTDETATVELAGFGDLVGYETTVLDGTYTRNGSRNGKPFYTKGPFEFNGRYEVEIFWDNVDNRWEIYAQAEANDSGEQYISQRYLGGAGNADYPWQSIWYVTATVARTATTFPTPATNNQPVSRWNNLVSGKPNLSQASANIQPIFKSDVFGRKAVSFTGAAASGDSLNASGFSTFDTVVSYYIVSTSINYVNNASLFGGLIRMGTSNTSWRAFFGVNSSNNLAVGNSATIGETTNPILSGLVSNNAKIWSARRDSSGTFNVGSNTTFGTRNVSGTISQSNIVLGSGRADGGRGVTTDISEVLVYHDFHDETTANQIIDYLAAKWSITL